MQGVNSPWGSDDLMVIAAFRYCLGRRTYIVSDCVDWLIDNWPQFKDSAKAIIKREVQEAFDHDDRTINADYKMLGHDCDRQQWDKIRAL